MKTIGVVGSGIAGLSAAYLLSRGHQVHLFEKEARLGGHTHTVTVDSESGPVALDTGFLVHNDRTYPRLTRLFRELGIETTASDMCFSVTCPRTGFAYSSRGLRGFFAQTRNLWSASHARLLYDIFRFNREASASLTTASPEETVGAFLDARRFNGGFAERYLLPMASAIWSASLDAIREFPLVTLTRFLDNHGLLMVNGQPKWKVVRDGSSSYIPRLTAPLADRVHRRAQITAITREPERVRISFHDHPAMFVDEVVIACHGDQVLPLLTDATAAERSVFSQFETTTNHVCLHSDEGMLPTDSQARASWNYRLSAESGAPPTVTYHLNRLQGVTTREQYCVTLNPCEEIDERRVITRLTYRHPLYTRAAVRAQGRWTDVSGHRHTHYCGAYWFDGFHEDGLRSGLRVASSLGVDW